MAVKKDDVTNKWYFYGTIYYKGKVIKRYKKRGYTTRREALNAESNYLKKYTASIDTISFEELADLYIEQGRKQLKQASIDSDRYLLNTVLKYIKNYDYLDKRDMQLFMDLMDSKYSKNYVSRIYFYMSKIYNFGVENDLLSKNPMMFVRRDLRLNEKEEEMTIWESDDFDKFIVNVDDITSRCMFLTLFYMGLRKGEMLALQWTDIDLRSKTFNIKKTYKYKERNPEKWLTTPKTKNSYRTITAPDILIDELRKLRKEQISYGDFTEDRFLFGYYRPMSPNTLKRRFDKYYEMTEGLPYIRIHDFRHSHASFLINNMNSGFTDFDIAKRLGDTVETLHNTYAHWFKQKDKNIIDFMNSNING